MQAFFGTIVSAKTPQTVAVEFTYSQKHPKYKKIIKRTTRVLAHNEFSDAKEGDQVWIVKSRPYSKLKHFKVSEVIGKTAVPKQTPVVKKTLKKTRAKK